MTVGPNKKAAAGKSSGHQGQESRGGRGLHHRHPAFSDPGPSSSRAPLPRDYESAQGTPSGPPMRRQRLNLNPWEGNSTAPVSPRCSPPPRAAHYSTALGAQGRKRAQKTSTSAAASPAPPPARNSEDEDEAMSGSDQTEDLERRFEELLQAKGLQLKPMVGDGACLFRAVADQIYGDQEMHGTIRKMCMDYMEKNQDHFSQFVTEDYAEYIARKRADHVHGNHVEMQAIAEVFARPVQVFQYSNEPINTFQTPASAANPPIRVSYHGSVHYNSVVDPYGATIGVGLGLPGLQPGAADKNLLHEAIKANEAADIERAMLEDKLRASDREATEEKIDEQVARDSYLQFIREQELRRKESGPCTSRATTSDGSPEAGPKSPSGTKNPLSPKAPLSSKPSSPQGGKPHQSHDALAAGEKTPPGTSKERRDEEESVAGAIGGVRETDSLMNQLSPSLFGLEDWGGENEVLRQVLALSQEEYLQSLKQHHQGSS